uniref:phosphomevalonate kinase n=1 Tax=Oryza glumipatula TaxID=40148 RepID=A0A0D9ZBS5_9ORYZ
MPLASYAPPRRKRSDLERRRASSCLRRAARATRHFPPPAVSSGSRPPSLPKPRMAGQGGGVGVGAGEGARRGRFPRCWSAPTPASSSSPPLASTPSSSRPATSSPTTNPGHGDISPALPGGHLQALPEEIDVLKGICKPLLWNKAVQFSVAAAEVIVADKEGKDALDKLCFCKVATIFYSYREQIEARGLPLTPDQKYCFRCLHSVQLHLFQKLLMEIWNNDWSKPEVAKTGLGSSAAMTTSIVAALLHYLGAVSLSCLGELSSDSAAARDLDLLHAVLMQFPH